MRLYSFPWVILPWENVMRRRVITGALENEVCGLAD